MKKLLIVVIATLVLTACGGKTETAEPAAETSQSASEADTDVDGTLSSFLQQYIGDDFEIDYRGDTVSIKTWDDSVTKETVLNTADISNLAETMTGLSSSLEQTCRDIFGKEIGVHIDLVDAVDKETSLITAEGGELLYDITSALETEDVLALDEKIKGVYESAFGDNCMFLRKRNTVYIASWNDDTTLMARNAKNGDAVALAYWQQIIQTGTKSSLDIWSQYHEHFSYPVVMMEVLDAEDTEKPLLTIENGEVTYDCTAE